MGDGARRVLITGVTGQDGSYLAESLVAGGHEVYGLVRRRSTEDLSNIASVKGEIRLLPGDLADRSSLDAAVKASHPDEVYNLAAMSHVGLSFKQPCSTIDVDATGVARMLEAVRHGAPRARFYQAGTSELFGSCTSTPHEIPEASQCRYRPVSPYACAKLAAHHLVRSYREGHGLFAVNGVLFNHESPRRGPDFVTRKISLAVARRAVTGKGTLRLGDVSAVRDWGYAPEYVQAMRAMLAHGEPGDWVVGTGRPHTVMQFLRFALDAAGLSGDDEPGWISTASPDELRPVETRPLAADTRRTRASIGWEARTTAPGLARLMVRHDMRALEVTA